MSNSRHINYAIRPAKGAERKMIVDLCRRLSCFFPLVEYQYVGYGGAYFCDFALFHRSLNIARMISVEKDLTGRKRFDFNKPFDCIRMEYGQARDILPDLDWTRPSIVWMDETVGLSEDLINVVCGVVRELVSGSLLLLSVSEIDLGPKGNAPDRDALARNLGRFVPDLKDDELAGPRLQVVLFDVFCRAAQSKLDTWNEGRDERTRRNFLPVLNISYRDNKRMATFGGLVLSADDALKWGPERVQDLPFVLSAERPMPYEIEVPNLSLKEVQRINECLPGGDLALCEDQTGLNGQDIQSYGKIYRYYMQLSEVIG